MGVLFAIALLAIFIAAMLSGFVWWGFLLGATPADLCMIFLSGFGTLALHFAINFIFEAIQRRKAQEPRP
jgi:uncharacterized membrane protein YpjA